MIIPCDPLQFRSPVSVVEFVIVELHVIENENEKMSQKTPTRSRVCRAIFLMPTPLTFQYGSDLNIFLGGRNVFKSGYERFNYEWIRYTYK